MFTIVQRLAHREFVRELRKQVNNGALGSLAARQRLHQRAWGGRHRMRRR